MRAYGGRIFRLQAHLDRLDASAASLGTVMGMPRRELATRLRGALRRSGVREAVVRVAMVPSPAPRGGSGPARPHIVVQPIQPIPAAVYRRGIRVAVVPARKFCVGSIDAHAKYSARLGSVMAVTEAQLRGTDEALFLDETGSVTESTASNVGIVSRGRILTPPCWLGLLAGITREVLFEAARTLPLPIEESPLTRHDLYNAEEAFLTSTLKEVLAVTMVDGRRIGTGRPGPITKRLHRAFREIVRSEMRWSR
jgi:branched-chain amino acid aminotransferase